MYSHIANEHTRRAYVRWWGRYVAETQDQQTGEACLAPTRLRHWLADLVRDGAGASSVQQARAAVLNMCEAEHLAGRVPGEVFYLMSKVRAPAAESGQRPGRWLSLNKLRAVEVVVCGGGERATADGTARDARDRVLFLMLGVMGLRCCEAIRATWDDLEMRGADGRGMPRLYMRIHGKGSKVDWLEIPGMVVAALEDWRMYCDGGGNILRRCTGGRVSDKGIGDSQVRRLVGAWGEMAGIGHLAPHDLRRTVAGLLQEAGASVDEISALLRHNSTSTTRAYLAKRGSGGAVVMADILNSGDAVQLRLM